MFGRAAITLSIGPHHSLLNLTGVSRLCLRVCESSNCYAVERMSTKFGSLINVKLWLNTVSLQN